MLNLHVFYFLLFFIFSMEDRHRAIFIDVCRVPEARDITKSLLNKMVPRLVMINGFAVAFYTSMPPIPMQVNPLATYLTYKMLDAPILGHCVAVCMSLKLFDPNLFVGLKPIINTPKSLLKHMQKEWVDMLKPLPEDRKTAANAAVDDYVKWAMSTVEEAVDDREEVAQLLAAIDVFAISAYVSMTKEEAKKMALHIETVKERWQVVNKYKYISKAQDTNIKRLLQGLLETLRKASEPS